MDKRGYIKKETILSRIDFYKNEYQSISHRKSVLEGEINSIKNYERFKVFYNRDKKVLVYYDKKLKDLDKKIRKYEDILKSNYN